VTNQYLVIVWPRQVHQKPFYNNTDSYRLGQKKFWCKERVKNPQMRSKTWSDPIRWLQEKKKTMIVNIVNYKIKSDYDNLHKKNACRKSNEA
jgi:hypothetical protein